MPDFNRRITQILLLLVIILLFYLILRELYIFLPGLLGALTLYILSRANYFQLIYNRKWKKGWAALLFIFYYLFIIGLPVFLAIMLISPKLNTVLADPGQMIERAKSSILLIQDKVGFKFISENSLTSALDKLTAFLPSLLNSTANLLTNLVIMLFVLYHMLYNGKELELTMNRIIPLKPENIHILASETKRMVKANALGIPLISIIQGATAALGYFIFGVNDWALWGFLTGVFAFFPVIGTFAVSIPLVIYTYSIGQTWQATALLLYAVLITGNVDYIARITLLRKLGDVHPVITILGVIVGLGLFGFIGLIFGPLLISYVVLLFNIYANEFINAPMPQPDPTSLEEENESVKEEREGGNGDSKK